MNKRFSYKLSFLIIVSLAFLCPMTISAASQDRVVLIVTDSSNKTISGRVDALKKYLVHFRQKNGKNASTLPILAYDFSDPKVKNYCKTKLDIDEEDLPLLGIATAKDKLPVKIHFKIINPKNLEKNASVVIEKAMGKKIAGILEITSNPSGAKVYINDEYAGKTPLSINDISDGAHRVTFEKQGFHKTVKEVTISGKTTVNLDVTMPSSERLVTITSDVKGAKVYINGAYYGETPLKLKTLSPGEHKFEIKNEQNTWTRTIEVKAGENQEIKAVLSGATGPTTGPVATPTSSPPTQDQGGHSHTGPAKEAFIPRTEQNSVFRVSVTNLEEMEKIKDYYKPKPECKFIVVYLSQQNISSEVQIYTGKFALVDQKNSSFEPLENLSNFWLVVLRPSGMNIGYLVYEIPNDSEPMGLVLHGLNMSPLTVPLK